MFLSLFFFRSSPLLSGAWGELLRRVSFSLSRPLRFSFSFYKKMPVEESRQTKEKRITVGGIEVIEGWMGMGEGRVPSEHVAAARALVVRPRVCVA